MTTEKQQTEDQYADIKQQSLLSAALALAVNPDIYSEDIGPRVQLLKETLDSIVFAE